MSIAPVNVPPANGKNVSVVYFLVAASWLAVGSPKPVILFVPIAIAPDIVPPARGSLVAIEFVTVVEKLGSSLRAAASSLRVSSVPGAEATKAATSVST